MPVIYERKRDTLTTEFPLVVNAKDRSVLVYVPAGEFEMGDGEDDNCPKHTVYLDAYYMGIYCVTNAQYRRFVDETGHRAPDTADWGDAVWSGKSFPEAKADHPVVCVSWDDGAAYAEWAGLSLPSGAQWEKAARGPEGFKYPWGDEWDESKCRNSSNRGSETTCAVWDYPSGRSGYGTYNQSGNVWEWCADWYDSDYYGNSPRENPTGPGGGSVRVYRGWSLDLDAPGGVPGRVPLRARPGPPRRLPGLPPREGSFMSPCVHNQSRSASAIAERRSRKRRVSASACAAAPCAVAPSRRDGAPPAGNGNGEMRTPAGTAEILVRGAAPRAPSGWDRPSRAPAATVGRSKLVRRHAKR